ncbi:MAG TPA: bacterial transcriptional activator domain-containing protein [Longimicrobium sp.]
MRKKDLALLVYLCVEGKAVHSRARLASLLWGESPDEAARHSLTQALGRLGRVLPPGSLVADNQVVRWAGDLPCDAVTLLRGGLRPEDVDEGFSIYEGEFLRGFHPGPGAEAFTEWADGRRADLRNAALRLLEGAGADAEEKRAWWRTVGLAERAVQIDPLAEHARRRLMRVWAALGERNRALRHYQDFAAWLDREMDAEPDPDTRALADRLRAEAAEPPQPPPRRAPAPPAPSPAAPPVHPPPPRPAGEDAGASATPPAPAVEGEADGPAATADPGGAAGVGGGTADPDPEAAAAPASLASLASPRGHNPWIAVGGLLLAVIVLALGLRVWPARTLEPVGHGESVRERGSTRVYLAFAETLYAYPDAETLHACTGRRTPAVRQLRSLPDWPRARLPAVRRHPWLGGTRPVVSDDPRDRTAFVAVGCILVGVPDPPTLDSIFGPGSLQGMMEVPDAVLRGMPRAFVARGHPLRGAGTLLRAPDGTLRWITYHGGALAVADSALLAGWCRAPGEAVDVGEAEFRYYRPFARLHPAKADCRRPE